MAAGPINGERYYMGRNWSIEEQVYVQPDVKLRFEFTSAHTELVARGEDPPVHDKWVVLNVYNESNTRVIRINFTRAGQVISSLVENVEGEVPLTDGERAAQGMAAREPLDEGTVTDQQQAWQGINLAEQFSGDI
jgi:hypothetical protein